MALFTFFLEYQGGTYLSQVHAENYEKAPRKWIEKSDFADIPKTNKEFKAELLAMVESEEPVQLEGLIKTWCLTYTILDRLALVHFTQTSIE